MMVYCETFGIRVEASTIHFGHPQMGWTYSIRLKLIDVTKLPRYQDNNNFYGAQLLTRHWVITNSETGEINRVDGRGVVGYFPILHKDGYINIGPDLSLTKNCEGWFSYQSMSGPLPNRSTFGGSLTFCINRDGKDMIIDDRSFDSINDKFDVVVPTFVLDVQEYYY